MRQMVSLILLFLTLGYRLESKPTIALILCTDTFSKDLKEGAKIDELKMRENFSIFAKKLHCTMRTVSILSKKEDFKKPLAQALSKLKKDDVVVFYFSGHGEYDRHNSPYPNLLFPLQKKHHYLAVNGSIIEKQVKESSARLKICIFDSCNSGKKMFQMEKQLLFFPKISTKTFLPGLKNLFKKTKGAITVIAASPHRPALLRTSGNYAGSYLTTGFLHGLIHSAQQPNGSWKKTFKESSRFVKQTLNSIQHPIYIQRK